MMYTIRSGKGIGDNLYMQAIVRALCMRGVKPFVYTHYPEIFRNLPVKTGDWNAIADYVCHYAWNREGQQTSQFEDCCRMAGVFNVDLKIDWTVVNLPLIRDITKLAGDRKIIFVNGARPPFNRTDGYGMSMVPNAEKYQLVLKELRERGMFTVYVGKAKKLFDVPVDLDLHGKTSVTDIIDIAYIADGFFGQCSFVVPLAESFYRPVLAIFAHKALFGPDQLIRTITPKKILHRDPEMYVRDDWSDEQIREKINAFCNDI